MERTPIVPPTILVVEDNPDDAMVVNMTFEESGIANPLIFVEDGQMAVDYLNGKGAYTDRARYPSPLLVILDINLPKRDGFDVLQETADNRDGVTVVVLTSSDSTHERERARDLGVTRVIQKPIDPAKLLRVISEIGGFSMLIVPTPT